MPRIATGSQATIPQNRLWRGPPHQPGAAAMASGKIASGGFAAKLRLRRNSILRVLRASSIAVFLQYDGRIVLVGPARIQPYLRNSVFLEYTVLRGRKGGWLIGMVDTLYETNITNPK